MTGAQAAPASVRRGAAALAAAIARGETTARAALDAQIAWIRAVNPALNALVLERFEAARAEAERADAAQRAGAPLGPLHGVPLTLKEQFAFAELPATLGAQGPVPFARDGPLVARLRAAGAIVLGKTNVPQLLIYNETDNPVYGRTVNPWNPDRSPGGSTGGEAALIAAYGSPLGLGSDIGGSLRTPAHACGIASLKPTSGRLSNDDARESGYNLGQTAVLSQPGPLARSVEDLALMMRVLCAPGHAGSDPDVAPVAWREPSGVDVRALRVGVYEDDGFFPSAPPVRRAVREAAQSLRAAGVTVVPFAPPAVDRAMEIYLGIMSADGAQDAKRRLGRSARDRRVSGLLQLAAIPGPARPAAAACATLLGQRRLAFQIAHIRPRSAGGYWQLVAAQAVYRREFTAALDAAGLDALLCPPHALPALTHGSSYWLATAASYSMLFNLLGMPAGVVPVTVAREDEDRPRDRTIDAVLRTALAVRRGSGGLPIGVQLAARHWREDVVLALMSVIEEVSQGRPAL